ncbi:MAG TPA: hypothetical protein VFS47_01625 [Steroidobacteraceae bacterium]|jgi:hypothetical protein|nr:hypothetical protein [Steroidobacteraceae bacterium]
MTHDDPPSDLVRRLLGNDGTELRDDYLAMFERTRLAATRRMHEPLAPEDFATAQAFAECSALAAEILSEVWESLHSN